jgi:hypothetical protein
MVLTGGLPVGAPIVGMIVDYAGPRVGVLVGSVTALIVAAVAIRRRQTCMVMPVMAQTVRA